MRLPYNPLKRLADTAVKDANVQSTGITVGTTPTFGSNADTGANDPTTGLWMPYGIVGITPNDSFMVPGR